MPREVEWERPLLVWQRKLCQGGAIVASCLLMFGIGGILVLTGAIVCMSSLLWGAVQRCRLSTDHTAPSFADKRKTGWLTNSEFGRLWERIVALNYVFVPLCVVGGMLGAHTVLD